MSTRDPDLLPAQPREVRFGPSDSSDSGSDLSGYPGEDNDSDRNGTGEDLTVGDEPDLRVAADIAPDRIVGAEEAGLGGGLDQAEEALLGLTDEEIAERLQADEPAQ